MLAMGWWLVTSGFLIFAASGFSMPIFLITSQAQRTELKEQGSYAIMSSKNSYRHSKLGQHLAIQENSRLCFVVDHVFICSSKKASRCLRMTLCGVLLTLIRIIHSFLISLCFNFRPTYLEIMLAIPN